MGDKSNTLLATAVPDKQSLPVSSRQEGRGVRLDTTFDVAFADRIARLETYNKHHYRPNTYLHKWWARRCGSTFRLILKHLVEDEALQDYYAAGGLTGKVIMDPMMGGGTTLHEAIRLGANVIGIDLDPIPVLQVRAALSQVSLVELEKAYNLLYRLLRAELAPYYLTTCPICTTPASLRFTLFGLRRFCDCGPVLVVDSLVLRQESDGTSVRLCPRCHAVIRAGDGCCNCPPSPQCLPIVGKEMKVCPTCRRPYEDDLQVPYYARYEPLVVVGRCPQHKLFFKSPSSADLALIKQADSQRATLNFAPEEFAVEPGRKSIQLIHRHIHSYLDLFSSRQLLYLKRAITFMPRFDPLIGLNLALLVSTSLEFNSLLCGYKGSSKRRAGAIRHTFSHHAYSFPYTALENNPIYGQPASGTLQQLFEARLRRGRLWAKHPRERNLRGEVAGRPDFVMIGDEVDAGVEVNDAALLAEGSRRFLLRQGSAVRLELDDNSVDHIVTDPPYFDSVQYSDLAAFFRVWLRQLLPEEAQWQYNTADSAVSSLAADQESQYTEVISGIFRECHRVLRRKNGRFIFTFHHWNPKGWASLTIALKRAGFILLNRYVVHAENPTSVHIANLNALVHDAILIFASIEAGIRPDWQRPERVNQNDSYAFCYDCAGLLGWMLAAGLDEASIMTEWQRALA